MPTPNYSWPFPGAGSSVDVPRDIEALARAIDTTLKAQLLSSIPIVRNVVATLDVAGASGKSVTITYAPAFPAGMAPIAYANITTNSATWQSWDVRSVGLSLTGCTLQCAGPTIITATAVMDVIAIRPPTTPLQMAGRSRMDTLDGMRPTSVTCRTSGCPMNGVRVPDLYVVDVTDPEVRCGACDTIITDID